MSVKTYAQLIADFAANSVRGITSQKMRDFVDSVFPPQIHGVATTKATQQNVTTTSETKITYSGTAWDTDSYFNDSLDRIVIPSGLGGLYRIDFHAGFINLTSTDELWTRIFVSTSTTNPNHGAQRFWRNSGGTIPHHGGSMVLNLVPGDYIEHMVTSSADTNYDVRESNAGGTYMAAHLIGVLAVS